jgi:PTH1 family peptidyl-tRNA hydrolase
VKLILGLGNPDEKYVSTRHNFGFRAIDAFAEKFEFPEFKLEKKFKAEISEKKIGDDKIILAKPQTFMNLSGEAAATILSFYKPLLQNFLIIYDDVDLPFGNLRFREGGSSGGHNGVKSLIQHFGTENFARLKLGTSSELRTVMPTEEFVLGKFSSDEEKAIPVILEKAVAEIEKFLENHPENLTN